MPLEHSVICRLTIRLPDGTILTKCDAGGYAGLADPGDDDKSGFADAFKRTAVKFGVGRYLYRDGVPKFSCSAAQSAFESEAPEPVGTSAAPSVVPLSAPTPLGPRQSDEAASVPRTGRALFAWTKNQDEKYEYALLKHMSEWAKTQDLPARMVDWDSEQVSQAYAEACRRVRAVQTTRHGAQAVLAN